MDEESLDYYHYKIIGNGDVWLNTGTLEEPHWELMMPDYEKQGIALNDDPINWDGPLVKSRNFDLADKVFYHFPRQAGKTAWLKAAPSVDENSYWYTTKEDTMQDKIRYVCDSIRDMLLDKNESYGNSALDPVRIFSDADADEQLLVRIDDKLSRIMRGNEYVGDDDITDLIGYLILLKIAREQ